MPLQATSGTASYDAFGGKAAGAANYIEDVFSTWLYTGNGSTQTITNGIDLSTKGGLTWIKNRSRAGIEHALFDTNRGSNKYLASNTTDGQVSIYSDMLTSFNSNGFSLGADASVWAVNKSSDTYTSWTFREQPKFFDVVTYTGNGTNRTIAHNLGSVPGCIIVKRTDTAADWQVYHRSLANTEYLVLNSTAAKATGTTRWNSTTPTSTVFSLGTDTTVNANGGTYVAYVFAHDAGGFGLTGTDNVISCGSFTTNASGGMTAPVTLGYEPQWILTKNTTALGNWIIDDVMRGMSQTYNADLYPNTSGAEVGASGNFLFPTATGFNTGTGNGFAASATYIYIAIRRGPMKTPTTGTSVFAPVARTGTGGVANITAGFPPDLHIGFSRTGIAQGTFWDRLRGPLLALFSNATNPESSQAGSITAFNNTTDTVDADTIGGAVNASGFTYANWIMGRAPGFFDVVCATANGSGVLSSNHNLGVSPELIITKVRSSGSTPWYVYCSYLASPNDKYLVLNATDAVATYVGGWSVSSTSFTETGVTSSSTNVVYLFASCPGVSKVGSYTGTGATLQINCGFTGGARFVLIKRTNSTGDWYVWDSARGIVAGNDPYLMLNSATAEVTTTDWVDTYSAGFELSNSAGNNVNINTATYIFLAIA